MNDSQKKLVTTAARLKFAGIDSLEYFHCDHFEPWEANIGEGNYTPNYQLATTSLFSGIKHEIEAFVEQTEQAWYSKSLSLFYLPALVAAHREDLESIELKIAEGDAVGFVVYDGRVKRAMAEAMSPLSKTTHEIQLHIHHENFTQSNQKKSETIQKWLEKNSTLQADEARFRLALEYTKKLIEDDTGKVMDNWAFIHGKWALNASDTSVCRLTNELTILKEAGCIGDFTFPAGRKNTNPLKIQFPFTCIPANAEKCYDIAVSAPLQITERDARSSQRFFIWNSVLQHRSASLDYYSDIVQKNFHDPIEAAYQWLSKSPILNNRIYLKTHAHSMARQYWQNQSTPVIPHQWPLIKEAFDALHDCLSSAEIKINCRPVSQIHAQFMDCDEVTQNVIEFPDDSLTSRVPARSRNNEPALTEKNLKEEMDSLWKANVDGSRGKALDIAKFLKSSYGTKNAVYLLGLAAYLGKGTSKNWNDALIYFSDITLATNPTVSFYRATILLDGIPTREESTLATALISEALEAEVPLALKWKSMNPDCSGRV